MKKSILLSFAILSASLSFAQSSSGYIEIGVAEAVDLNVEEITMRLIVRSAESQMEDEFYYDYYEDDYYYDYEEDYYYEQMLEETPKKVTSEMKKEFENRQKEREEREMERERERAAFKPYWAKEFMALLKANNITYTIQINESDDEDEYYDYEYSSPDTAFQVVMTSGEEYDKISGLAEENPVYTNITDKKFEKMDNKYEEVISMLTAKAKSQAKLLAVAMGKRVGNVTQVTNNFESNITDMAYEEMYEYDMYDRYDYDYEYDDYDSWSSNPFDRTKKAFVQYLFRFAVVN